MDIDRIIGPRIVLEIKDGRRGEPRVKGLLKYFSSKEEIAHLIGCANSEADMWGSDNCTVEVYRFLGASRMGSDSYISWVH